MNRKTLIILACAAFLLGAIVLHCYRVVSERAREVQINDTCQKLAIEITVFRVQEGYYPRALPQLPSVSYLDEGGRKASRDLMSVIQHNAWGDRYEYVPGTNGFTIRVCGPKVGLAGWFGKVQKVEKHYPFDDASVR
jgi:hypothetical protein